MGGKHTKKILLLSVITVSLICANYLFFGTPYFMCIIKELTGYDCPACGTQRAVVSILRGDLISAFWYNPYLVLLLLIGLILAIIKKKYLSKKRLQYIVITLVIVMVMWVIVRNLQIWQDFVSTKMAL
jgi:hypothetical protein